MIQPPAQPLASTHPSATHPQPTPQAPKSRTTVISSAVVALVTIVVLLGANLVGGLLLKNTSQENQVIASHREALRRNKQNIEKLQADLLAYSGKVTQLNSSLPEEENIPEFIQFMTDSATKLGSELTLNFTSNQPSVAKDGVAVIPMSMQLLTTTESLLKFVDTVHQSKYQVRFELVEVEIRSGNSNDLEARLLGKLFVSPQFSSPGKT